MFGVYSLLWDTVFCETMMSSHLISSSQAQSRNSNKNTNKHWTIVFLLTDFNTD